MGNRSIHIGRRLFAWSPLLLASAALICASLCLCMLYGSFRSPPATETAISTATLLVIGVSLLIARVVKPLIRDLEQSSESLPQDIAKLQARKTSFRELVVQNEEQYQ
jgi:hypothetical protein